MQTKLLVKLFYTAALSVGMYANVAAQGVITTIAGTGVSGSAGDGGLAIAGTLSFPTGVAVSVHGDVYVTYGATCRKIDGMSGIISNISLGGTILSSANSWIDNSDNLFITDRLHDDVYMVDGTSRAASRVCGSGRQGSSGDGGRATAARTMTPSASCVDASGNLYVAECGSNKIRKVDASTGIINTIAGTGTDGFTGDHGLAVRAQISRPTGICVDLAGNVYFSDAGHRVRRIDGSTGTITTAAGNGTAGFSGDGSAATSARLSNPTGLFTDYRNELYIADKGNNRIRKVSASGIITTVAGTGSRGSSGDGGVATAAQLNSPNAIWVDYYDNLYIADQMNNKIRKVTYHPLHPKTSTVASTLSDDDFVVYPNPANNGKCSILTGAALENAQVVITNAMGAVVHQFIAKPGENQVSLDTAPGFYMVTLTSGSTKVSKRIVVNQ